MTTNASTPEQLNAALRAVRLIRAHLGNDTTAARHVLDELAADPAPGAAAGLILALTADAADMATALAGGDRQLASDHLAIAAAELDF
ncbi:hypothetical protein AS188_00445 [Kocuria flava]|uniref:Uncharacterized protein n=1 Tax=Kocuria flava TaxID=446860 RepID=A0A0U2WPD2_9MICC|nr:hypothetical protein [Kocuria flava]ALU38468.1 hypothetical protein AS188_00445 [Kocuria flava]GEO93098.1 hypothetical protein KFL01_24040 [Kocuria flava]